MRPYCGQMVKGPGVMLRPGEPAVEMLSLCETWRESKPRLLRYSPILFVENKPYAPFPAEESPVEEPWDLRPHESYEKPFPFSFRSFRRAAEAEIISDEGKYEEAGDLALPSTPAPAVPQIEMSVQMLMSGRRFDWQPGGIAVMSDGRLLITDMDNDCLRLRTKLSTSGLYLIFYCHVRVFIRGIISQTIWSASMVQAHTIL